MKLTLGFYSLFLRIILAFLDESLIKYYWFYTLLRSNIKLITMKNIGFMIVALILGHTISAQIQQESFDASEIPDGWIYEINSNATSWQFGYTGVMPHSGPTIESEFARVQLV